MLLKVKRDVFFNHNNEKFLRDQTFVVDDDDFSLKAFYDKRIKERDLKIISDNKPKNKKDLITNNEGK